MDPKNVGGHHKLLRPGESPLEPLEGEQPSLISDTWLCTENHERRHFSFKLPRLPSIVPFALS